MSKTYASSPALSMKEDSSTVQTGFQNCPILGVGLGLRKPIAKATLEANELLDWLEITPENFMSKGGRTSKLLGDALEAFPIVSHGVNLSIASPDSFDELYLSELEQLFERVNPPWFSDHLCIARLEEVYINDLLPILKTKESLQILVDRVNYIQDRFQRPFLLENISYYMELEANSLREADFIAELVDKADCGLLLDVNNVYVNQQNLGQDAHEFLSHIPLNRVVQIHMAGHSETPHGLVDTHGSEIVEPVWDLLDWTLARCRPCGVMIERDNNIPAFETLAKEIERLKALWDKHYIVKANPQVRPEVDAYVS